MNIEWLIVSFSMTISAGIDLTLTKVHPAHKGNGTKEQKRGGLRVAQASRPNIHDRLSFFVYWTGGTRWAIV